MASLSRKIREYLATISWKSVFKNMAIFLVVYAGISFWVARNNLEGGQAVPVVHLKSAGGNGPEVTLPIQGTNTILYFWATWCPVCKTNMHVLPEGKASDDYRYIMVLADPENEALARQILRDKGLAWELYLADENILRQYSVGGYPTTYFINQSGKIAASDTGLLSPPGLWWRQLWTSLSN